MSSHAIISRDSGTALCLSQKYKNAQERRNLFSFSSPPPSRAFFFFFFSSWLFFFPVKTSRRVNGKFTKQVSFFPLEQDYSHALNL